MEHRASTTRFHLTIYLQPSFFFMLDASSRHDDDNKKILEAAALNHSYIGITDVVSVFTVALHFTIDGVSVWTISITEI